MSKIVSKEFLDYNPFYIIKDGNIFQMRFKGNHYVISNADSFEGIMRNAQEIYSRYNTPWLLEDALRDVRITVSDPEKKRREKQYKCNGKDYEQELHDLIKSMTGFSKKLTKKKKANGKLKLKFNK